MPYFDPSIEADAALLPAAYRDTDDLAREAAQAEHDILAVYTQGVDAVALPLGFAPQLPRSAGPRVRLDDDRVLCLRGYAVDPAAAAPALREALRRTVARVLFWRLQRRARTPMAVSESSSGGKSVSYAPAAHDDFPAGWDRELVAFDTREVGWAL